MASPHQMWVSSDEPPDEHWFLGTLATVRASSAGTGGLLSVVEFFHPPGFATPRHIHRRADEAFYVLSGAIRGFCGDREWSAGAGTFVWLPKGLAHGYVVDEGTPVRTLAITVPGGFDRFVTTVGEPAPRPELPTVVSIPDMDLLLAAAAADGQEILGPPPETHLS